MRAIINRIVNIRPVKTFLANNRYITRLYFNSIYLKENRYKNVNPDYEKHREESFSLLEGRTFRAGLELGCGEGHSTRHVAAICKQLTACDISERAISRARKWNALPNTRYIQLDMVKNDFPGKYDYIFCAEILYYFTLEQLDDVVDKIIASLEAGGIVHLLHHRTTADDDTGLEYKPFGAKTIHGKFENSKLLRVVVDKISGDVRTSILERVTQ